MFLWLNSAKNPLDDSLGNLIILNKRSRIPKRQQKRDNPEKLSTLGTQDEDKQNKNTTQYVLDTTLCKQIQTT